MTTIEFSYETTVLEEQGKVIVPTDEGTLVLSEITPKEAEDIYQTIKDSWNVEKEIYQVEQKAVFLKMKGKIYYAPIGKKTKVYSEIHRCASCKKYCEKVKKFASKIWEYDYITFGIETVGTEREQLVVQNCRGFDRMTKEARQRISSIEMMKHINNIQELVEGSSWSEILRASL